MIITEVGQKQCYSQDHRDGCAIGLCVRGINWFAKTKMKYGENTNKGYIEPLRHSNGLGLRFDLYSYMVAVEYVRDTLRRFRAKGWTDRQEVVNVLD